MKKTLLMTTFIIILLQACSSPINIFPNKTVDRNITGSIALLHFNDLHAHLIPHKDKVRTTDGNYTIITKGGIARLKTVIDQQRDLYPNSILMNIGDTFHGGAEAMFTLGNAIVKPVNALGIDIGVPGNWDFAYGPIVTRERYTKAGAPFIAKLIAGPKLKILKANFKNLAANVKSTNYLRSTFLDATYIKNINGIQVGFIGLTSDIVPHMHSRLATGFDFLQGEKNYIELLNKLSSQLRAQGSHIVVVMSELGIQKDFQLAQKVAKGIDVFFSAHTHELTPTPLMGKNNTLVVEAGNDGYLGRMKISLKNGKVIKKDWELLSIDETITPDSSMQELVTDARELFLKDSIVIKDPSYYGTYTLTQSIDTVIGHTHTDLDRRALFSNSFNQAFSKLIRDKTHTDIGMTPGFRFDSVIEANEQVKGDITLEDIFRFFPVSFPIATATISRQKFQELLDEALHSIISKDAFRQKGGWLEGFYGVDIEIDASNQTIRHSLKQESISVSGCIKPDDEDDILCSHHGFDNVAPFIDKKSEQVWSNITILLDYLKEHTFESLQNNVTETTTMKQWPKATYIQPIK
jgi:S-sulfosulfanyl-L-cysteine sulfohydrolase